jgi:hypothetical protein
MTGPAHVRWTPGPGARPAGAPAQPGPPQERGAGGCRAAGAQPAGGHPRVRLSRALWQMPPPAVMDAWGHIMEMERSQCFLALTTGAGSHSCAYSRCHGNLRAAHRTGGLTSAELVNTMARAGVRGSSPSSSRSCRSSRVRTASFWCSCWTTTYLYRQPRARVSTAGAKPTRVSKVPHMSKIQQWCYVVVGA